MKKNRITFLVIFLFIGNDIFSIPQSRESFIIRNNSSKTLIINREYNEASLNRDIDTISWTQDINGFELNILPDLIDASKIELLPGRNITIVQLFPYFSNLDEIPFIDKMRMIFNSLEILTEDGEIIATLDNLEKHIVKQIVAIGPRYFFDIYDRDFIFY